jgi:hypothetical protein
MKFSRIIRERERKGKSGKWEGGRGKSEGGSGKL